MENGQHFTKRVLEAGLPEVLKSPKTEGEIQLIIRRPALGEREVLESCEVNDEVGLVGDTWLQRPSSRTPDKSAHPDAQINIMNARAAQLVAGSKERWKWAGDQFYIDLDLSLENLPAGTRLEMGSSILEVTALPHTGCKKFVSRFGIEAMKFVNSPVGRANNLRGINAKVVKTGMVRVGDNARKV